MSGWPTARRSIVTNCDLYAWHGDAELLPHLWAVLQMPGIALRLVLHEPVLSWSVQSRKVLGHELREQIGRQLTLAHAEAHQTPPELLEPRNGGFDLNLPGKEKRRR